MGKSFYKKIVFVNSMSDLFHEKIPDGFIIQIFDVMKQASWHRFQILTKRSDRLRQMSPHLSWADNIWMGVTVENRECAFRIEHLRGTPAAIKFISMEPLLEPLKELDLDGINWVIVGGESGPGARPLDKEWIMDIKEDCQKANIPFFFKQWGGFNKKKKGRLLEGRFRLKTALFSRNRCQTGVYASNLLELCSQIAEIHLACWDRL